MGKPSAEAQRIIDGMMAHMMEAYDVPRKPRVQVPRGV